MNARLGWESQFLCLITISTQVMRNARNDPNIKFKRFDVKLLYKTCGNLKVDMNRAFKPMSRTDMFYP